MTLFGKKAASESLEKRPDGLDRLPPGQYLTKKWPVLSYERTPKFPANWQLNISGEVENPLTLSWEEFLALPRTTLTFRPPAPALPQPQSRSGLPEKKLVKDTVPPT